MEPDIIELEEAREMEDLEQKDFLFGADFEHDL